MKESEDAAGIPDHRKPVETRWRAVTQSRELEVTLAARHVTKRPVASTLHSALNGHVVGDGLIHFRAVISSSPVPSNHARPCPKRVAGASG